LTFKLPNHIVSQRGKFYSNFLIENFTEISQKSAKLVQFTLEKKNPNFFQTFCQEKENLSETTSQGTYNKCFIMVTHDFVSTCQDKAEPFRTTEW
jgi:hypothetical protein